MTNPTTALKPCPFCGASGELKTIEEHGQKTVAWIACTKCDVLMDWNWKESSVETVVEAWNTRAQPEQGGRVVSDALSNLLTAVNGVTVYWRHQHRASAIPGKKLDGLCNAQLEAEKALREAQNPPKEAQIDPDR